MASLREPGGAGSAERAAPGARLRAGTGAAVAASPLPGELAAPLLASGAAVGMNREYVTARSELPVCEVRALEQTRSAAYALGSTFVRWGCIVLMCCRREGERKQMVQNAGKVLAMLLVKR